MIRRLAVLAVTLGALLSGCSYEPAPKPAPVLPAGFDDQGNGTALRQIDKECSPGVEVVCWWVEVYVYENCPDGGDIDVSFFEPAHDAPVQQTDYFFPALNSGQTYELEFWTVLLEVRSIEVTSRGCRDYD